VERRSPDGENRQPRRLLVGEFKRQKHQRLETVEGRRSVRADRGIFKDAKGKKPPRSM